MVLSHAGTHEAEEKQLWHLQLDLVSYILQLTGHRRSILNARLASSLLRDAANAVIKDLRAPDGTMPPGMWRVFPSACRLVCVRGDRVTAEVFLRNLMDLFQSLPERLKGVDINAHAYGTSAGTMSSAQSFVTSACSNSITNFTIQQLHITAAAADAILTGFKNLQNAHLSGLGIPHGAAPTWRPSADLSHMAGKLSLLCSGHMALDLAGLSTASKLHSLRLDAGSFINLQAISSLTSLRTLQLDSPRQQELSAAEA